VIEFQTEPDPIFLAILAEALQWTRDQLYPYGESYQPSQEELAEQDEQYPVLYPSLARFFSRSEALAETQRLLSALHDPRVYRFTDYHWLVLYASLEMFTDLHNDEAFGSDGRVGPYTIDAINFDDIVSAFFFDTDFLFGPELLVASEKKLDVLPGVTPQAVKIAAGIKPSAEDLEFTPTDQQPDTETASREATTYPTAGYIGPYPMRERGVDER